MTEVYYKTDISEKTLDFVAAKKIQADGYSYLTNETDKQKFNRLFPVIREYQALAQKYNINDIFQDNGGKYLQLLMILGLTSDGSREGNDAIDSFGNEYEIKTVNLELVDQFSTHHHLNPSIIEKYRKVDWFFAPFKGIELQAIFRMKPEHMEYYYKKWEEKWVISGDINNPKIPLNYVMDHGTVEWLPEGVGKFEYTKPKKITEKILTLPDSSSSTGAAIVTQPEPDPYQLLFPAD